MRRSSATVLRIRLLGGFRVEVGAQVIADDEWRLQKARGLVKLLALAGVQRELGDVRAAQVTLSRLVAEEPIHEEARARLMRLMRLHCVAGERWHALREYAQLRTALRQELDVEPGLTTQL